MSKSALATAVKNAVGELALVPETRQTTGMLSKTQLTNFFSASSNLLDNEAVQSALKAAAEQDEDPDDVITDLQKDIFEAQGIAGEWGIKCLGLVADTYQQDGEFMQLFVAMVEREEEAVNAAELPPEEFEAKKKLMRQMRQQNDALVAQMEGMGEEERQRFLEEQITARLNQLSPEDREQALEGLLRHQHQCGENCGHDHGHEHSHQHSQQHQCTDDCGHDHSTEHTSSKQDSEPSAERDHQASTAQGLPATSAS